MEIPPRSILISYNSSCGLAVHMGFIYKMLHIVFLWHMKNWCQSSMICKDYIWSICTHIWHQLYHDKLWLVLILKSYGIATSDFSKSRLLWVEQSRQSVTGHVYKLPSWVCSVIKYKQTVFTFMYMSFCVGSACVGLPIHQVQRRVVLCCPCCILINGIPSNVTQKLYTNKGLCESKHRPTDTVSTYGCHLQLRLITLMPSINQLDPTICIHHVCL